MGCATAACTGQLDVLGRKFLPEAVERARRRCLVPACKTRTREGCLSTRKLPPDSRTAAWRESLLGEPRFQRVRKEGSRTRAYANDLPAAVERKDSPSLRGLFPSNSSHKQGYVKVSDLHTIYYEVFGNPQGKPAVFLHGGPGAGCTANHSRFFDPEHYQIVLFDQRGCGKSTPRGCLEENNTWELVEDVEKLRQELSIERWLVVGGSWGTTLALAYAQTHPTRISAMVLRAVCMMRKREIDWFYRQGADALFPFAWQDFVAHIPEQERDDLLAAYYRRLTSDDKQTAEAAAKSWLRWEMSLLSFSNMPVMISWDGKDYKTLPMPAAASTSVGSTPVSAPVAQPVSTSSNGSSKESSATESGSPPSSTASASTAVKAEVKEEVTKTSEGGNGSLSQAESVTEGTSESNGAGKAQSTAPQQQLGGEVGQKGRQESSPVQSDEGSSITEHRPNEDNMKGGSWMSSSLAQARLESHYSMNGAFLSEDQLLKGVDNIRNIPTVAVQGRYDFVCPLKTAFDLHSAWPEMELRVIPNAGHSQYEPGITHEIIEATEKFKSLE